jgi:chemotaxis protein histidine kinase CheA
MREKATEFSGRGFGLDLVKQKNGKKREHDRV